MNKLKHALLILPIIVASTTNMVHAQDSKDAEEIAQEIANSTVYKSPNCGCCAVWVDYMKKHNIMLKVENTDNVAPIKKQLGISDEKLYSCHTAVIGGYVIEGHVPVSDILRLLKEKPDVLGLTAPGMPRMSPGMASENPKDYTVYSVSHDNDTEVFSKY